MTTQLVARLFKLADRIHNARPLNEVINELVSNGNPKHAMLHFTDHQDLFGINPKYKWQNPNAIYGYLINEKNMDVFRNPDKHGTDRKYCIVFRPKDIDSVLDLAKYSDAMFERDFENLLKMSSGKTLSNLKNKEYLLKEYEGTPILKKFGSNAPTFLWLASWCASGYNAHAWTKVLSKLGYTGVVDTAGTGLIHPSEPFQGFLLSSAHVKPDFELYNNTFNVSQTGTALHAKLQNVGFVIRSYDPTKPTGHKKGSKNDSLRLRLKAFKASVAFNVCIGSPLKTVSRYLELQPLVKYLRPIKMPKRSGIAQVLEYYSTESGAEVVLHLPSHTFYAKAKPDAIAFVRELNSATEQWLKESPDNDLKDLKKPWKKDVSLHGRLDMASNEVKAQQQLERLARKSKDQKQLHQLLDSGNDAVLTSLAENVEATPKLLGMVYIKADLNTVEGKETLVALLGNEHFPPHLVDEVCESGDPKMQNYVAQYTGGLLDHTFTRLLSLKKSSILERLVENNGLSDSQISTVIKAVAQTGSVTLANDMMLRKNMTPAIWTFLSEHENIQVRLNLVKYKKTPDSVLLDMAQNEDVGTKSGLYVLSTIAEKGCRNDSIFKVLYDYDVERLNEILGDYKDLTPQYATSLLERALRDKSEHTLWALVNNKNTPLDILKTVAKMKYPWCKDAPQEASNSLKKRSKGK